MNMPTRKDSVIATALLIAIIGTTPFTNPGCKQPLTIEDPLTGQIREVTQEELTKILEDVGTTAKVIAITTGQPQAVPFVELGVRLAAILVAFFYGRPKQTPTPKSGVPQ